MKTFTFLVKVPNQGAKSKADGWPGTVWAFGNSYEEAVSDLNDRYDQPLIIASFEGGLKPIQGDFYEAHEFKVRNDAAKSHATGFRHRDGG
jgi:hypothetical protein